jgi:hypothetical protein
MKHKITKREYHHECGDGCCDEWGATWTLNGEEIYNGPQDEEAWLNILTKLGIQAEVVDLAHDTGEELCSLDNFVDFPKELE